MGKFTSRDLFPYAATWFPGSLRDVERRDPGNEVVPADVSLNLELLVRGCLLYIDLQCFKEGTSTPTTN